MSWCRQITDAGLAYLTGIHTLDITRCALITDAGLAPLRASNTKIITQ